MFAQTETGSKIGVTDLHESVGSYAVRAQAMLPSAPTAVPAGTYVAHLSNGGVGSPSFAVLPYLDGAPAEFIVIADPRDVSARSPRYVRVASSANTVDYQLSMPPTFRPWVSHE